MGTEQLTFLSARIPTDLMKDIEKMANEERRSMSQMSRILLEEAIAARQAQ